MNERIVFLVRNVAAESFGGGEIYQLKLAARLKDAGFLPIIVTNSKELLRRAESDDFKTLVSPYLKNQNWSGWRNILLPFYFGYQVRLKKWYEEVIKYYKPEVINIQSRDDLLAATKAARKFGIKILWTDHADFKNWVLWNVNVRFKNIIGKNIIKYSKYADKVIFVSNKIKEETEEMIRPLKLKNSIVINNGVEDEFKKHNVMFKKHSFVFVGRVVEEKGISELVQAFLIVAREYKDAELNIYGGGKIKKYRQDIPDGIKINFCGETNEPIKALAQNEIFVLPSHREGLSLSLLEAAMMEKKIIASDVGGNSEVIEDKKTGLLVPAKDVQALSEAMIKMIENEKAAEMMAKKAREHYKKNFDFEKIFEEKMLPLYNNRKEEKK